MSEKIIVILLIAAIIISVFSMVVTLSLNANDLQTQKNTNFVDKPDLESSNIGLIIVNPNANTQG
jgi:hypothetical protein